MTARWVSVFSPTAMEAMAVESLRAAPQISDRGPSRAASALSNVISRSRRHRRPQRIGLANIPGRNILAIAAGTMEVASGLHRSSRRIVYDNDLRHCHRRPRVAIPRRLQ